MPTHIEADHGAAADLEPAGRQVAIGIDGTAVPVRVPDATLSAARAVQQHHAERLAALRERQRPVED